MPLLQQPQSGIVTLSIHPITHFPKPWHTNNDANAV
jgi:hypothetical protein